ncbi:MAG TPA: ATP synthase F1 subunit epsilon, partial [Cellvibrionaceae bacterium]|nr:ATP synthase F1 subunit epsilon [Cellvibrionaceae bacterium]
MAKAIKCNIVSAENEIYSGEAELLIAATTEGDVGVGFGHSQLLAALKPGPVRVLKGGDEEIYYVSGGFLEVQPSVVTILADTA